MPADPSCPVAPVQRPLAPRWVMLSLQLIAYYGLIRATPLPLDSLFASPTKHLGNGWVPTFICTPFQSCHLQNPGGPNRAHDCSFPARTSLRQFRTGSASTPPCLSSVLARRVTRLSSSLALRPDWLLARHRHGLLLSSFRANGYPLSTSSITTRQQSITAAGLSPARDAALWAADGITRIRIPGIVPLWGALGGGPKPRVPGVVDQISSPKRKMLRIRDSRRLPGRRICGKLSSNRAAWEYDHHQEPSRRKE